MPQKKKTVAVIGATGLVGQEVVRLLIERQFPMEQLRLFASPRSAGKIIHSLPVEKLETVSEIDLAFFCAGAAVSKQWIPQAPGRCIDLSSAFRMDPSVPLVIPEINAHAIQGNLIASPNCAATILLMPLFSLHRLFGVKRVVVSTYQAASGGGARLLNTLQAETRAFLDINRRDKQVATIGASEMKPDQSAAVRTTRTIAERLGRGGRIDMAKSQQANCHLFISPVNKPSSLFPYAFNLYPHNSPLHLNGYVEEEIKMEQETRKILEDPTICVSATCIRVPVLRAHAISANVEFKRPFTLEAIYDALGRVPSLKVFEDRTQNRFATPADAAGKNEVFCGRFRIDRSQPNTLEFWSVGDPLLKGAALNAVQIAETGVF